MGRASPVSRLSTHTDTHTHTHAHAHTHTDTDTDTQTHTHTDTHRAEVKPIMRRWRAFAYLKRRRLRNVVMKTFFITECLLRPLRCSFSFRFGPPTFPTVPYTKRVTHFFYGAVFRQ